MKLIYLANVRVPTEKAHGLQIMKMAEAFRHCGHDLELWVARRFNAQFAGVDPFAYYRVSERFPIKRLWLIDMVETRRSFHGLSVVIQNTSFAISAFCCLVGRRFELLYSRDQFSLFLLSFFRKNLVWEMHEFPRSNRWLYRRLMKRLAAIVVITRQLKDLVVAEGVEPGRVTVAPDGVDLAAFAISETKQQCRQRLGLPSDMRLIVYTGHLWSWKGVYVLAEAAAFLSADCLVLFVGGMEYDLEKLKRFVADRGLPRIQFVGLKPPAEIAYWLAAADCLVLPNSGQREISRRYTSPLKLFEYMAARRPIVASRLPAILEILNERNAILVEPDEPKALAAGIEQALKNEAFSAMIVKQAFADVQGFTWQQRAQRILLALVNA
ncbi:MAG: hypothetical protein A3J59_02385 [Candidatus Buchananbacteria bacterium RIFCSPHIGHO2_02_FULL_56_16]|uniref:Glycosyltransferase subfamily 4-like N-terminal domain-containing protein n=1 Tax=Candidatus Buchananbacteria bacterium RIFCSPHIGHO2_02_FULL_56_16 TaxID=1797542 RepID=A0A1G1YG17_9BACT|nr:MAG: hypothetical protein A3J59_02385 [Candidatus Buchananbacteria bacterium RIFCSPHIGHO2_02_FULL_56_16]